MNLATHVFVGLLGIGSKSNGLATSVDPIRVANSLPWLTGTGANEANQSYSDSDTLAAGVTTTIDFAGGGLNSVEDAFGDAVSFARIKVLYVKNTGATNPLTVGGTLGILGGGSLVVRPGGMLMLVAPDATAHAVVNSSSDQLTLASSAGTTFELAVIGATS